MIEGQLQNLLGEAEKGRNFPYADKLRKFLEIWRSNEITGDVNRETLDALLGPCELLAVDSWDLSSYFMPLRDNIRVLITTVGDENPAGVDLNQNDPMAGGGGGGGGHGGPPMNPDFGPGEEPPGGGGGGPEGGPGGPEGDMGAPSADNIADLAAQPGAAEPGAEEAPGAEEGAPAPEEGGEAPVAPEEMTDEERFEQL
jgi:hypothetical protein